MVDDRHLHLLLLLQLCLHHNTTQNHNMLTRPCVLIPESPLENPWCHCQHLFIASLLLRLFISFLRGGLSRAPFYRKVSRKLNVNITFYFIVNTIGAKVCNDYDNRTSESCVELPQFVRILQFMSFALEYRFQS